MNTDIFTSLQNTDKSLIYMMQKQCIQIMSVVIAIVFQPSHLSREKQ